jgi:hypothetical protein
LVANGVARDATKSTYARVMAKTLGGEAEHEAEKLADAEPEAAVAPERHAAVQIAGDRRPRRPLAAAARIGYGQAWNPLGRRHRRRGRPDQDPRLKAVRSGGSTGTGPE